jgi:hypothetical protein
MLITKAPRSWLPRSHGTQHARASKGPPKWRVEESALAPGVRVALRNLDMQQLETQMARGDVDLALMTPQVAPLRPGLGQHGKLQKS